MVKFSLLPLLLVVVLPLAPAAVSARLHDRSPDKNKRTTKKNGRKPPLTSCSHLGYESCAVFLAEKMRIQNFNSDVRPAFKKSPPSSDFFPGAFAYHWHSVFWRTDAPSQNSLAEMLLIKFNRTAFLPAGQTLAAPHPSTTANDTFNLCGGKQFDSHARSTMQDLLSKHCGSASILTLAAPHLKPFQAHNSTKCLQALASLKSPDNDDKCQNGRPMFHTLLVGLFGPPHKLFMYSFASTQHVCARMTIWFLLPKEMARAQKIMGTQLAHLKVSFQFKLLPSFTKLVHSTPLHGHSMPTFENFEKLSENWERAAISDVLRFVLLFKYGGVWVDIDTVFLKDFTSLMDFDFMYRWSRDTHANTAVMRICDRGTLATILRKGTQNSNFESGTAYHPNSATQYCAGIKSCRDKMLIMPAEVFDPAWPHTDAAGPGGNCPNQENWC